MSTSTDSSDALTLTINGEPYEVAPPFTNRELHLIKQVAGVRGGEMFDAIESGDNDVLVALAHIAVRRKGRNRPTLDELWDMAAGAITVQVPDGEPDPTAAADDAAESGSPETTPQDSGPPSSDTSSDSPPVISAT